MERVNLLRTLLSFAIFIATGCNDSYNTVPIATAAKNFVTEQVAQKIRDAATLDKPSLIVVASHAESWEQFHSLVAELVFVNPLKVPVSYRGYTPGSFETRPDKGRIHPLYQSQMKGVEERLWHDCSNGFCGTGVDEMIVRPGEAGRFLAEIHPPLKQPTITSVSIGKIGFTCTWLDRDGVSHSDEIWSDEISNE